MLYVLLLCNFIGSAEVIPFKPNDQFELTMAFEFKNRPPNHTVDLDYRPGNSTSPLPYLSLNLKIISLMDGEDRIKISDSNRRTMLNKKVTENDAFNLDLGFTDDMKDRTSPHEYFVHFLSADKKTIVSRILIDVGEDGTFTVNGEKRGKL